jgi:hypothetical protein
VVTVAVKCNTALAHQTRSSSTISSRRVQLDRKAEQRRQTREQRPEQQQPGAVQRPDRRPSQVFCWAAVCAVCWSQRGARHSSTLPTHPRWEDMQHSRPTTLGHTVAVRRMTHSNPRTTHIASSSQAVGHTAQQHNSTAQQHNSTAADTIGQQQPLPAATYSTGAQQNRRHWQLHSPRLQLNV